MPFESGKSGNPGGRPKRLNQAAHLARQHADKAIQRLAELLDSKTEETRRKAACDLLDRGFGKPKEFHEITGEDGEDLFKEITVTVIRPKSDHEPST